MRGRGGGAALSQRRLGSCRLGACGAPVCGGPCPSAVRPAAFPPFPDGAVPWPVAARTCSDSPGLFRLPPLQPLLCSPSVPVSCCPPLPFRPLIRRNKLLSFRLTALALEPYPTLPYPAHLSSLPCTHPAPSSFLHLCSTAEPPRCSWARLAFAGIILFRCCCRAACNSAALHQRCSTGGCSTSQLLLCLRDLAFPLPSFPSCPQGTATGRCLQRRSGQSKQGTRPQKVSPQVTAGLPAGWTCAAAPAWRPERCTCRRPPRQPAAASRPGASL